NFCNNNNIDYENEFKLNGLKYDILLNNSLLIELNGLKWHSVDGSKERDLKKYDNIINIYDYMMLYEDELVLPKIQKLILNRLNLLKSVESLRPSKCEIKHIDHKSIVDFYNKHHYIGKVNAKVHYGVFYEDELISAMSFGHPTRQTS